VALSLEVERGRVTRALAVDRITGTQLSFAADHFVMAAGALATPHLLLASGLERLNPAGEHVGRHLMRHCNGIVVGASGPPAGEASEFRKQIGIHDFYFGDPSASEVSGRLGAIQQVRATQIALLMAPLPRRVKSALNPVLERLIGFIVIAEDQPRYSNRVFLDRHHRDRFGRPLARIHHRHTPRDLAARRALSNRGDEVLKEAGCAFTLRVPVSTFSHGLGTVRMGEDPKLFPVSPDGCFRGTDNLWITDGSVFPTSAAVNPSLTISANALRVAHGIVSADRWEEAPRAVVLKGAPWWPRRQTDRSEV
jgi:choline dehydrogenase-like flavoprotein